MDNNMMDAKTLAYINLYAVLGSLKYLCELSPEAKKLAGCRPVSIGFDVHGGPAATLTVGEGCCTLTEGVGSCDIKLPFRSAEKFNGMIAGTVTPIPTKGLTKVGFLTGRFTKLTNLLTRYLKPTPEDLKNEHFFHVSTVLMFRLIVAAAAQIGNHAALAGKPGGKTQRLKGLLYPKGCSGSKAGGRVNLQKLCRLLPGEIRVESIQHQYVPPKIR